MKSRGVLTRTRAVAVLAAVIVAAAGFSIARAGGTTINACANKSTGALRMLKDGQSCSRSEEGVSWNQQGPPGPQGPQGQQGPAGSSTSLLGSTGLPYTSASLTGADCASGAERFSISDPVQTWLPAGSYQIQDSLWKTMAPVQQGDVIGKAVIEVYMSAPGRTISFRRTSLSAGQNPVSEDADYIGFDIDAPTFVTTTVNSTIFGCGEVSTKYGGVVFLKVA